MQIALPAEEYASDEDSWSTSTCDAWQSGQRCDGLTEYSSEWIGLCGCIDLHPAPLLLCEDCACFGDGRVLAGTRVTCRFTGAEAMLVAVRAI